jgi:hypothetical protein
MDDQPLSQLVTQKKAASALTEAALVYHAGIISA